MIITYNLKPFFFKDLGSFSKSYLKLKLWVVKLLKLNIEKPWFDYQDTRCCNLAILNVLPKLLPGPNLHFRFMKNSVYTSLLWSLGLSPSHFTFDGQSWHFWNFCFFRSVSLPCQQRGWTAPAHHCQCDCQSATQNGCQG